MGRETYSMKKLKRLNKLVSRKFLGRFICITLLTLFSVIPVTGFISVASAQSTQACLDDSRQTEIQQLLDAWRERSGIPSASVSILLPNMQSPQTFVSGSTVYQGGNKITPKTLFQIGSVTKSFTSTIILLLESQGKLNINDHLTQYLPQYSPRWDNITLRELLNHTSGIYNYTEAGVFNAIRKQSPRAGFTSEQLVHIALSHRDYFPAGHGWKYSNTNYVILGMIIEKVTGQPINQVMNHYLHGGFNIYLPNTYYASGLYTPELISRMAHGYSTDGEDTVTESSSWANSAGGIISNTQDLITWWKNLFTGNILPKPQLDEMMTLVCSRGMSYGHPGGALPRLEDNEVGHGYGLGIIQTSTGSERTGTVWWHNGTTKGYEAITMWFPKHNMFMSMIIARNPGYFIKPTLPIIQRIVSIVLPGGAWHPHTVSNPPTSTGVSHHTLRPRRHHNYNHKHIHTHRILHETH